MSDYKPDLKLQERMEKIVQEIDRQLQHISNISHTRFEQRVIMHMMLNSFLLDELRELKEEIRVLNRKEREELNPLSMFNLGNYTAEGEASE